MDTTSALLTPVTARIRRIAAAAILLALALVLVTGLASAPSAQAAEQRERIQLVERPRDALALVLYGTLGLITVAGVATLRRQLKGEREQTDGEFRWR
jgi:NhaP-type Na+/H+ or K+/H+ antiporter